MRLQFGIYYSKFRPAISTVMTADMVMKHNATSSTMSSDCGWQATVATKDFHVDKISQSREECERLVSVQLSAAT